MACTEIRNLDHPSSLLSLGGGRTIFREVIKNMRRPEFRAEANVEQKSELSPDLSKMLALVFREYPELRNTKIETFTPTDNFDAGGFYEFEEGENGDPIPKICISEGDAELLRPLLEIRKSSVAINAEMLGLDSKDITPQLLQYFIIAHELGHIKDYKINFEGDPDLNGWEAVDEMNYQRDAVLTTLPVPNMSPTYLARELDGLASVEGVVERFPELQKYHDFEDLVTVEDVLAAQEEAYRSSAPESYADEFAVNFLRSYGEELGIHRLIKH